MATMRPFRLPDGAITHEWFKAIKAMVLQLDPDGEDDAERAIRSQLERRMERELTSAFGEQLSDLLPPDAGDDAIRNAPHRVQATSEPVREVLRRNLVQSSSLGVSVAFDTLEQIGLGFDYTLAHSQAARWASTYSYELIRGINASTTARMQTAVNDWFRERTTLPDLVKELEPTFGRKRSKLIAQTETTRAAREGSVAGYEQSGVVEEAEWVTVNDERVCPTCGPLNGKRAPLRGSFSGASYPPAHPGCRCFVRPVIAEAQ
jgi:SPP1 gp7 family putative phage head morphogenesis protein